MAQTSATGATSSSEIQTNYLNLLITQLKNQNPLEPMDNNQMSMQLAQLSSLQQLESMNAKLGALDQLNKLGALDSINGEFERILLAQQVQQSTDLLGKNVTFAPSEGADPVTGKVERVELVDGKLTLKVGDYSVLPSDVTAINE